ncbi:cell cycle protein [Bacillus sp. FJAT-27264]|uniref:FtsW/RodA/SpoVE family cell cycle protein n=1 Tax=Paenibacillus sp. (strain DSM 101736 / FJAT-27264) TaxID=1850362 RepID=UPI000807EA96|nr:FtsW/RodA/SpoVE family cell cycle protein [Bacillus sp. FJAT-27264]OBZ07949.1 cell cycle protein [Bacillus sp. FJAT-27264]
MLEKLKRVDPVIVVVLILLMSISIFSIYSVTVGRISPLKLDGFHLQMLKYDLLGFIAFFVLAFVDYKLFIRYGKYIYALGLGLLVLVIFIGKEQNGAQGWLKLGNLTLQPAELFKLVLILFLASFLLRKQGAVLTFWRGVMPIGLLTLIPFVLVLVQNDLGNALSYIVIMLGLVWIGNIKFTHALIGLLLIGVTGAGLALSYIHYHDKAVHFLGETIGRKHLIARLDPWLVPDLATADASYHTKNAKIAIASGGMGGEGYMNGDSVQAGRVPYTYSDAIFVQIAEEFGFLGSAFVLLLFFILIHRMIVISLECRERSGTFLIIGVAAMLLYQILENIGAFIGLMPLTGITLPFISYGGTSVLINMAAMGIVMSVHLHGGEVEPDFPIPSSGSANPRMLKV